MSGCFNHILIHLPCSFSLSPCWKNSMIHKKKTMKKNDEKMMKKDVKNDDENTMKMDEKKKMKKG